MHLLRRRLGRLDLLALLPPNVGLGLLELVSPRRGRNLCVRGVVGRRGRARRRVALPLGAFRFLFLDLGERDRFAAVRFDDVSCC
jgi:hypothetical protein